MMFVGIVIATLSSSLVVLAVAQAIMGLAQGIGYPVLMGMSIQHVSNAERSTAMGLHQAEFHPRRRIHLETGGDEQIAPLDLQLAARPSGLRDSACLRLDHAGFVARLAHSNEIRELRMVWLVFVGLSNDVLTIRGLGL